jgi:PAS domain S-box-containing protein
MIQDKNKTKAQLINELVELRKRITERDVAEKTPPLSKDFHQTVLDNIADGVWMSDKDDVIFYANSGMGVIAGVAPDQIEGSRVLVDFSDETLKFFRPQYLRAKETLEPTPYDSVPVTTPAGRQSYQTGWLIPRTRDGDYDGMVCTVADITQTKLVDALRESEERLKVAQKVGGVGDWMFDVETGQITWSEQVYLLFERDPAQGPPHFEENMNYYYSDDSKRLQAHVERAIKFGEEFDADYRVKLPSGRSVTHRSIIRTVKNEQGRVTKLYGTVQDITERKRAEESLRESEEKYRVLSDNMKMGLVLHGPDTEIIFSNPMASEILGIGKEQMEGKKAIDPIVSFCREDGSSLPFDEYPVNKAIASRTALHDYIIGVNLPNKDCVSWVAVNAVPVFKENGVIGYTSVTFMDVTESKQAEEELRQHRHRLEEMVEARTADLQIANKDLGDFAYSVSHDLKAPVRAIVGFSEIITDRHRDSLNEEAQRYFDHINKAGIQMGNLIEDLLRYSRLGRQAITIQSVSLANVFSDLDRTFQGRLEELNGRLVFPDDAPTVLGETTLLNQIFTNLIENALTYHQPDVAPQVEVRCQVEGDRVLVSVKDNGIGIAAEFHEKVFGIFQRLHNDEEIPGTGIGLALVRKAATMLGASVRLESVVGEGCTFHVDLPLNRKK